MSKEEKLQKNILKKQQNKKCCSACKYHSIDEIAFDYPQSICTKKNCTIEAFFESCEKFEDDLTKTRGVDRYE